MAGAAKVSFTNGVKPLETSRCHCGPAAEYLLKFFQVANKDLLAIKVDEVALLEFIEHEVHRLSRRSREAAISLCVKDMGIMVSSATFTPFQDAMSFKIQRYGYAHL